MNSNTGSTGKPPAQTTPTKLGTVLVLDDEEPIRRMLTRLLTREGYDVRTAADGPSALDEIRRDAPDIILLDVMMPDQTGFDVCRSVKGNPETRLTPVVLVTSLAGERVQGIEAGADDFITKPFDTRELCARVRSLIRVKQYTDDLDSAEAVIVSLALTIEARDSYTEGHCRRIARHARALGARLGLSSADLDALHRGGFLHDLGKIGVPDAVLLKNGPLTSAERLVAERHTTIGDSLCGQLRLLRNVRPIVRHHHERLDGSGYPDGLQGDAVPLLAQITSVVDVYDALTTDRPYRRALPQARAFAVLRDEATRGWKRPALVEKFIMLAQGGSTGTAASHDCADGRER